MSEQKYTPGPWREVYLSWEESGVYAGDFRIAAIEIDPDVTEETQEEYEAVKDANAKLIAAAPELLEALRVCVEIVGKVISEDDVANDRLANAEHMARDAIKKATE